MSRDDFVNYKIPNFIVHKKNLIDLIIGSNGNPRNSHDEKITKTDWSYEETSLYKNYLIENIFDGFIDNLKNIWHIKKIIIKNIWYQIYDNGDYIGPHNHGGCQFSNVIYLSLPSKELKTNIYSLQNELIDIDIEEGDILTFPSYLNHKSPSNKTHKEKIIISFNFDLE